MTRVGLAAGLRHALLAIDRLLRRRRRARRKAQRSPAPRSVPPARPRGVLGVDEGDAPLLLPDVGAQLEEEAEQRYLRELLSEPEVRIFLGRDERLVIERRRW